MWKLEISGALIHSFLLICLFDIHLQREVFQGTSQNCSNQPLAKRLVLIIANGLDGEETWNIINSDNRSKPFSSHNKLSGIWGLAAKNNLVRSNGITAITGGFEQNPRSFSSIYEKRNKKFDHIFNHASKTIYAGELKYLDYFGEKSKSWKKLIIYINDSKTSTYKKTLPDRLQQEFNSDVNNSSNVIIFVCLPEFTANPENKSSKELYYKSKMDYFEDNINKIIATVDKYYHDNETSFILCTDNDHPTDYEKSRELFMMWGKGVNQIGEVNIAIKDISLMASTIMGNPIPLGSTGTWCKSALALSLKEEAHTIACNAFHLSSMANSTLQQVGNQLMKTLHFSSDLDSKILKHYQTNITNLLNNNNNYSEINEISDELTTLSLKILDKDVIFMKTMLFCLTHSIFIGWALTLLIQLIMLKISKHPDQEMRIRMLRKKTELWFFGMHTLLILIGTTSVLFIILKDWPLHYIFYWLIALSVWGFVLGNFQTWTGIIDGLNFRKFAVLFLYTVIYGVATESFIWALKFKLVLCGVIMTITLVMGIKSSILKKKFPLKISSLLSGLTLCAAVLLPTAKFKDPIIVIATGVLLPIMGVICAYFMRDNSYDFLIMTVYIFLSSISLMITIFKLFYSVKIFEALSWILFAVGIFLPVFGGVDKTNRLQHIAVSFGSSITLLSVGCEPLIVIIVFIFSMSWYLNDKPVHKVKFLNRYNGFQVVIFIMLILTILHLIGGLEPSVNYNSVTREILGKVRLLILIFLALTVFTALKHQNGGESQLIMSILLLHYCTYRLFLEMELNEKVNGFSKQLCIFCTLQITTIILFATHSFSKFILHASIINVKTYLNEIYERVFSIRIQY